MQIEVMSSSQENNLISTDEFNDISLYTRRKAVSFNKKVSIIRIQSFKDENKENCYANCISKVRQLNGKY